jgi:hypothetical protein
MNEEAVSNVEAYFRELREQRTQSQGFHSEGGYLSFNQAALNQQLQQEMERKNAHLQAEARMTVNDQQTNG